MGDIKLSRNRSHDLQGPIGRPVAIAAVAVVVVVVVGVLSTRGPTARIAPPATSSTPSPDPTGLAASLGDVVVHVAGAVRAPGLYVLPAGARVADAIEAAGGATPRADLDGLNLAQPLADGTKIDVLRRGESPAPAPLASGVPTPGAPISLNIADRATLETVPGIGPVRAAAIITYRDEHGGFETIEELLEVPGIGPVTFASIRDLVVL